MKKIIVLCLAGVLLFEGCAQKGHKYIDMGMEAIESSEYDEALSNFDSGISANEDLELAYRAKGIAYLGEKNYDAAIEQFKQSLKQATGSIHELELDTSYYLAVAQTKKGDVDAALETYSNIIKFDKNEDQAYFLRGVVYLKQQNLDAALADFNSVIMLEPDQYDYYIHIYENLAAYGYADNGMEYLNKALATLTGDSANTDYYKGVIYYEQNDLGNALTSLQKASSEKSKKANYYLGKVYEANGDYTTALTYFQDYLNSGEDISNGGEVYNAIGLCQMNAGDDQSAMASFNSGIALNEEDSMQELLFNQIVAFEKLDDFTNAKEMMETYVQLYPDDANAAREYQFLKTR